MEIRHYGKKVESIAKVGTLTDIQRKSYQSFLQKDVLYCDRQHVGLEKIFSELFPISSYDGSMALEYIKYELGEPRFTVQQCRDLGLTYSYPLKLWLRFTRDDESVEESIYLCEVPKMIGGGEFLINGAERVVVSQIQRSPGVDFAEITHPSGQKLVTCRIIPEMGSWMELEVTNRNILRLKIDQRVKVVATCFLRATMGENSSDKDILSCFYNVETININSKSDYKQLANCVLVEDIIDPNTGEVLLESKEVIPEEMIAAIESTGLKSFSVIKEVKDDLLLNTIRQDTTKSADEAKIRIYQQVRPRSPAPIDKARELFEERFENPSRYNLGNIGRFRLNRKLNVNVDEQIFTLTQTDMQGIVQYLLDIRSGSNGAHLDDIDHLGNRRVRTIDQMLGMEIQRGLLRLTRGVKEKMTLKNEDRLTPRSLVQSQAVSSAIEYFFSRGELSHIVDQSNPLSQLTNERRLSALGPGGLNRKRAGFEVRDVHMSHYGRVCPIETPEGANIGLIVSLSIYASINDMGFIVTPYRKVVDGCVTDELVEMRADEEEDQFIVQADVEMDGNRIVPDQVLVRNQQDVKLVASSKVTLMDISTKQLVGVSASLIPFLEHDDANRALMGSNMQRQAVPLLRTEQPWVATGMEAEIAKNSGMIVIAEEAGTVTKVQSNLIVIGDKEYKLRKFEGLNERTCINQKPLVKVGEKVSAGQVISDGPATDGGVLALGKNITVAFVPWEGYNFEDAILVNENLLKNDTFTSIHIECFSAEIRATKLGQEEFTRDIPNVPEDALANLDDSGVVAIGTKVNPGDILVGKIAPRSKSDLTPEEKLLYSIFGKSAEDVKNDSLSVKPGVIGTVVNVKKFKRNGGGEDGAPRRRAPTAKLKVVREESNEKIIKLIKKKFATLEELNGAPLVDVKGRKVGVLPMGLKADEYIAISESLKVEDIKFEPGKERQCKDAILEYDAGVSALCAEKEKALNNLRYGDELPHGVLELVKVYVARKLKLQAGDKMAGRHGNKGVVSRVMPQEDMPFLEDGTPVDICLNPLGVPSRMNVGQILETHLGFAAKLMGYQAITPVFTGANKEDIAEALNEAGMNPSGKSQLYDGRTGEKFKQRTTVGVMYMLKLHHLVQDKIHARGTGPYSLITQQPLGGKARMGGQRFGEMEVWALEAYGAASILQELLTVKSDDVDGRTKIYESMIRGKNVLESGTPVSFQVLVNEIRGLGLNLRTEKHQSDTEDIFAGTELADAVEAAAPETGEIDKINDIARVCISIAKAEEVRSWSHGEVKKPETINYRSFRAERDGLFCEKIFGPTKDWECFCGKHKGIKYKGITCDRCGVSVVRSKVRRERMGHINLAAPVAHIWFFKAIPSKIANLLDIKTIDLQQVIYFQKYIVIETGDTPLKFCEILSEEEYAETRAKFGAEFRAAMGAEAIRDILSTIDVVKMAVELRENFEKTKSQQTKKNIIKRLRIVEAFGESLNKPEDMIFNVIPVIPPELRPLIPLESGNFATSDLNDLYRRVINRNNRLKNLMDLNAPEIIIKNEKRMLQQAVDALFDNARCKRAVLGTGNRPLKSLTDMIKGKQGRFRGNLLGKRVDYSARSVIVVGPELKLHQCGLPKRIALELYQPFIIRRLKDRGLCDTIKSARKMIDRQDEEIWGIVEDVIKNHPVMLNRAPTLHRLGIQAFEPVLIEGKAIQLHPLVCGGFNADFDGDQMAVHLPLSQEAKVEAFLLMMAPQNIFSPASGEPTLSPSQDIVLGCYFITGLPNGSKEATKIFSNNEEVLMAYAQNVIKIHDRILIGLEEGRKVLTDGSISGGKGRLVETMVGRVIFDNILPKNMPFYNKAMKKGVLKDVIADCYAINGRIPTIKLIDDLKSLGYQQATLAGISFGHADMVIPDDKATLLAAGDKQVKKIERDFKMGALTRMERYNQIIDIWTHVTEQIGESMMQTLKDQMPNDDGPMNPVYIMADSGARGSKQQIRQLAGMRGLMAKPNGDIIETPIKSNFKEGLRGFEYFSSSHGARKGLADTALKTADSGYLTRKLVDVSQNQVITMTDCGTLRGITKGVVYRGDEIDVSLSTNIYGRVARDTIVDIVTGEVIVKESELITQEIAKKIEALNYDKIRVRSPLTCEADRGICAKCYGMMLSTGSMVEPGTAVGIIAAQSIGEPGTQLTMRTFHIGGTASRALQESEFHAKKSGIVVYDNLKTVFNEEGKSLVLNRNGFIAVQDTKGREIERYAVPTGAEIPVANGDKVKSKDVLAKWDPHMVPIISEHAGKVRYEDIIADITMKEEVDTSGIKRSVIMEHKGDYHPQIVIETADGEVAGIYGIQEKAHLEAQEGTEIKAGAVLAKTPREIAGTQDITGGLPRVTELFEARKPKEPAILSEIDGIVEIGDKKRGKRVVRVSNVDADITKEYLIPQGKHLRVHTGDPIKKGEGLVDGPLVLQDILAILGEEELQRYLLKEVQGVYSTQNVRIDDKHIEIINRAQLSKVHVEDPGDSRFLANEEVDKWLFKSEVARLIEAKKQPPTGTPALLGVTKAAINSQSFISAASFQETTKVLTDAAITGKVDNLVGLKENVILGHVIPAGTGLQSLFKAPLKIQAPEILEEEVKTDLETEGELVNANN